MTINLLLLKTVKTLILVSMLFSSVAEAQKAKANANAGGVRKESLSFDDELVEGATQKPELFYLLQKKNFNYKKLIKLRENFLPEMRKTSEVIQRGGNSP